MAFIEMTAPRRDRLPFAKWFKKLQVRAAPAPPFPKGISDHIAQDIGLTAHDLEMLRFHWPSDGPQRPSL